MFRSLRVFVATLVGALGFVVAVIVGARKAVKRLVVSAAIVAVAAMGIPIVAAGPASAKAAVCPTLSVSGSKYTWETVGTGFTCANAKHWVLKLVKDPVDTSSGKVALTNGPKGYHCYAVAATKGVASDGQCYKGTAAFPKSGFAWSSA
jgi:hypothetical protein